MRVVVYGDTDTAKSLRSLIAKDPVLVLSERGGMFTIKLIDAPELLHPVVDGVDSEIERLIVSHIARTVRTVTVHIDKPSPTDVISIHVPSGGEPMSIAIERAVYRALLDSARPPQARPWWRFW